MPIATWVQRRLASLGLGAFVLIACAPAAPVETPPQPIRTPTPSASPSVVRPATGSTELFGYSALRGVAYNLQGSPAPGLEVALESREARRPYWRRIPVSEAGAYVFTNVPIMASLRLSAHRPGEAEALRTRVLTAIRNADEYKVANFGGPNSAEDPTASSHFIPASPTPEPTATPSVSPSPEPSASPTPTPFLGQAGWQQACATDWGI